MNLIKYISILFLTSLSGVLLGQTIQTEFGKNRIQYHDDFDNWWMYETENFITYWYGKGRNTGQFVVQTAEHEFVELQQILEHRINDKVEIIVYSDLTDVKQSNIGTEDIFLGENNKTRIEGNKMFVYFDGNHQHLLKSIRKGTSRIYLDAMLYGSNLQEIVQNAVLLKIPDWFYEGVVAFCGEEWGVEYDNQLRELLSMPRYQNRFDQLAKDRPTISGHMFWLYIAQQYGKSSIPNLLYLTRINRNLKSAFLYVLGKRYEDLKEESLQFFKNIYNSDKGKFPELSVLSHIPIPNKRKLPISKVRMHPDKPLLAYVLNNYGKTKIYLYDLSTNQQMLVLKEGQTNIIQETDFNYPIINWDKNGRYLGILHEEKDVVYFSRFDVNSYELSTDYFSPDFHRIFSFDFLSDNKLIFSASLDGFSDLFTFDLRQRQYQRLTEDFYDNIDVHVYKEDEQVVLFSSNRDGHPIEELKLDSIMPLNSFDIYALWIETDSLVRLTNTPLFDESSPFPMTDDRILYLSNENGIVNRKILYPQTGLISGFTSNHRFSINEFHTNSSGKGVDIIPTCEKIFVHSFSIDELQSTIPVLSTSFMNQYKGTTGASDEIIIKTEDQSSVTKSKYLFQSKYPDPENTENIEFQQSIPNITDPTSIKISHKDWKEEKFIDFNPVRAIASRLRFKVTNFSSTLDNSILFNGLDTYAGMKQGFDYPPMGILLKAETKDLFEDYEFEGGVRVPTSFNGSEYFLVFKDTKHRIDKKYAIYKKQTTETSDPGLVAPERSKSSTLIGLVQYKYPFDTYRSVRATATLRFDKAIELASNQTNLETPPFEEQRIGLKLEYVFDNTIEIDFNIRNGTRYKVYTEFVNKMEIQLYRPWQLSFGEGFMTVLGWDARHYQRLDRNSIFAIRFAGASSFGSEQNLYFLGGVENWMFPKYNETTPTPDDDGNYAYSTLAANMRGFNQNIRNGSAFAVINAELRIPLFKYISKRPIRSSFWRNFQIVGFVDVGSAWNGVTPFDKGNPLNILTLTNPLVTVNLNYERNPVVFGYGAGARAYLFGYFLKVDYAYGIENGTVLDPILYLSMGMDF
jgi:hypothetical protein